MPVVVVFFVGFVLYYFPAIVFLMNGVIFKSRGKNLQVHTLFKWFFLFNR